MKENVATMKHQLNQMIWGAMSCCGAAGLHFIPPNTTQVREIALRSNGEAKGARRRNGVTESLFWGGGGGGRPSSEGGI